MCHSKFLWGWGTKKEGMGVRGKKNNLNSQKSQKSKFDHQLELIFQKIEILGH